MVTKTPIVSGKDLGTEKEATNLSLKSVLLLLSINLIYFAQVANVVGSGALTRDITAAVGNSSDSGRKIFLVALTSFGFLGTLIIAGASSSSTAIAGFAVTGISYGAQPLLHAIVSEVFARKYRPCMCLPALVTAAHFATPQELVAITSSLMISLRSLGGSVGHAVYNAIFHHGFSSNLGPKIASAVLPLGLSQKELPQLIFALVSHNETAIEQVHGISPRIIEAGHNGLLEAYRIGFRGVWVTTACLSSVAGIAAFFLRDPTDDFTAQVDAPILLNRVVEEGRQGSTVNLYRMS